MGLHLAKQLVNSGCHIWLADSFSRLAKDNELEGLLNNKEVNFLEVDLIEHNQAGLLKKIFSAIIHLAAKVGVRHALEEAIRCNSVKLSYT
jgi:nucleoside-diphosphate-sugar epimerase